MGKFIGVDGEAFRDSDEYVLLANSYGQYLYNPDGIPTTDGLNFLLDQPKAKGRIFVGFGFNYDVNMLLRDLPLPYLQKLKTEREVRWGEYKLEWIPSKWFHISKGSSHIRIHEVFGFFQASFLNALGDWDIDIADELVEMKAKRSEFSEDMLERMIRYCVGECNDLSELMARLNSALKAVELRPSNWIGAGSIAAALLRQHKVDEYHTYDAELGKQFELASLTGYLEVE